MQRLVKIAAFTAAGLLLQAAAPEAQDSKAPMAKPRATLTIAGSNFKSAKPASAPIAAPTADATGTPVPTPSASPR
jgi:hypothetical protein